MQLAGFSGPPPKLKRQHFIVTELIRCLTLNNALKAFQRYRCVQHAQISLMRWHCGGLSVEVWGGRKAERERGRERALELRQGCVCHGTPLVSHSIIAEHFYLL